MHIQLEGSVWRILEFQHVKPGKGGAFVRSRLRNLDSGAVVDKTFPLREAAAERIQKTAQMMAEAVEHEGGIVFDSMNTLSGEMQRQADELESQAANYLNWAREREERYSQIAKQLQSIGR